MTRWTHHQVELVLVVEELVGQKHLGRFFSAVFSNHLHEAEKKHLSGFLSDTWVTSMSPKLGFFEPINGLGKAKNSFSLKSFA